MLLNDMKYCVERRRRRYNIPDVNVTMNKYFSEMFNHFVKGIEISTGVKKYIISSIKEVGQVEGLICMYKDQYLVMFPNTDIGPCAIKVTHSKEDNILFMTFLSSCSNTAKAAFYSLAFKLLKEKQRLRILDDLDIEGIIYSNYPEDDELMESGFVWFPNILEAKKKINKNNVEVVSNALNRGVTYEELDSVLPQDAECRFFVRNFNNFETAQIEALEHGCSKNA